MYCNVCNKYRKLKKMYIFKKKTLSLSIVYSVVMNISVVRSWMKNLCNNYRN